MKFKIYQLLILSRSFVQRSLYSTIIVLLFHKYCETLKVISLISVSRNNIGTYIKLINNIIMYNHNEYLPIL